MITLRNVQIGNTVTIDDRIYTIISNDDLGLDDFVVKYTAGMQPYKLHIISANLECVCYNDRGKNFPLQVKFKKVKSSNKMTAHSIDYSLIPEYILDMTAREFNNTMRKKNDYNEQSQELVNNDLKSFNNALERLGVDLETFLILHKKYSDLTSHQQYVLKYKKEDN